jgi:FO synthase
LADIVSAAATGKRLSETEALVLAAAGDDEQERLMAAAATVREQARGRMVTYAANVFIPLTKLCRDVCHYCTFARPPRPGEPAYIRVEDAVDIARRGAAAGCTEALFTLGDKPERRYRKAREELARHGCASTYEYVLIAARAVLEETGLLPHLNLGVVSRTELRRLRGVSASMGLMLESTSARLMARGMAHHGSPDKNPRARLATLDAAGRERIPFTTGILIGIGETRRERVESLLAIRAMAELHGHIQEVIVQNFRAKPDTLMADAPEPSFDELLWSVAVARLVLGPQVSVQAPPNLSESRYPELLDAGLDDWGGVSPLTIDHVNPEAPWPALDQLQAATAGRGLDLAPRLTLHPRYAASAGEWVDKRVRPAVLAASDSLGLARRWKWHVGSGEEIPPELDGMTPVRRASRPVARALEQVAAGEADEACVALLFGARGSDAGRVLDSADRLRREVCGDTVTYVVTRNINYTNVCYFRCGFCAFSKGKLAANLRGKPYLVPVQEIVRRAREAWDRGGSEVCLQGGIHPAFDGDFYLGVVRAIKDALPDMHVHAFSPLEVWQGAATLSLDLDAYLRSLRDAGLASLPGTAAEILDDEVRAVLCPDKLNTAQWLEVVRAAHRIGLRTTSTIMFGHVDGPVNWARHLLALRDLQAETRGITEFVPLPFVHMEAPIALRGQARHGPTLEETLLMHAVPRLVLHPLITNIQTSWVKLGPAGAALALRSGVNDLGGTLMNESISRAAGAAHGQELPPEQMEELIRSLGRLPRQRTTLYGTPPADLVTRSFGAPPLSEPINPPAREQGLVVRGPVVRPGLAATPAA